ncbi:MAG TPA: protein kinase [Polyangiaceae bacterium]|nr:protein kinase [Polyangiaceae bacterium]
MSASASALPIVEPAQSKLSALGLSVGDFVDGKFRIEELVGVGGMSCVVRACHVALDETVALKCLSPEWVDNPSVADRFSREARASVKIKNPHVARVYDVGRLPAGSPYMVMELLQGEDMGKLADRRDTINLRECVGWMIEACEGLAEAHALGIVHLDVKPENLFIVRRKDGRGVVKLLDFGISKQLLTSGSTEPSHDSEELVGTPLYMSPEQARVQRTLDHRTDIWSLGAVFYELLTGFPPFGGTTVAEVCASILEATPASPSLYTLDVPHELSRIVLRCLEKDPGHRFPSMAELASALLPFAHPHHHAQVDRIIGTLRAAGLTQMAPVSIPPVPTPRDGTPLFSDSPTLLQASSVMQRPVNVPGPSTSLRTEAGVQLPSKVAPAPAKRGLKRVAVLAAVIVAALSLFALTRSRAPAPAPAPQAAEQPVAPQKFEPVNTPKASLPSAPPVASEPPAASARVEATSTAEPEPSASKARARKNRKTARVARALPAPNAEQQPVSKPVPVAPSRELDIELSR